MTERIKQAAIKLKNGEVVTLERPNRHGDIFSYMRNNGYARPIDEEQGFITEDERFVDREEAYKIAFAAGQILPDRGRELYTEDLW